LNSTEKLIKACYSIDSIEPEDTVRKLTGEFLEDVKNNFNQVIPEMAIDAINKLPPFGASWLSLVFGSAIESGAELNKSRDAVVNLLDSWISEFPVIAEDAAELPKLSDKTKIYIEALPLLSRSVVSHVARTPSLRQRLYYDSEFIIKLENTEAYTYTATWIRELLEKNSSDLLIIHVESRRGIKLKYTNVSNCFHLFSLIQTCVGDKLQNGRTPSEAIYQAARCLIDENIRDEAWWHYGDPLSSEPNIFGSIWGEVNVRQIPVIEGIQIILLWPMIMNNRCWDSGFFGPRIDSAMPNIEIVQKLEPNEINPWLEKLKIQPALI